MIIMIAPGKVNYIGGRLKAEGRRGYFYRLKTEGWGLKKQKLLYLFSFLRNEKKCHPIGENRNPGLFHASCNESG
jgi:hypothetical protein